MDNILITKEDIYTVAQVSRLTPFITKKASDTSEIGKIFGLGVAGFIGSVIEIEAIAFKAYEKGKGILCFNQTAGSMAQDSVFNAAAVVRKLTNEDIHDYDIHINIIGGGNIDGPSAGTAILIALISAITQKPIRQDIAITGEISIQGLVRPVGGVFEKAYGASQAGIKTLIIPEENAKDIPPDLHGLKVHPVKTAQEALAFAFDKILRGDYFLIDRVPPQNIEAEQAVLGAMLISKEAIAESAQIFKSTGFFIAKLIALFFEAMLDLSNRNQAVDNLTVIEQLNKQIN